MYRRSGISSTAVISTSLLLLLLLLLSISVNSINSSYALTPPPPGAYIYLDPPAQDISALGSATYNLTIQNWGYEGWVKLTLGKLPEGVTVKMIDAVYVTDYQDSVTPIYVTVSPFVKTSSVNISVTSEATPYGKPQTSSSWAELNIVSSISTTIFTQVYTRTLANDTLTVSILSTTTYIDTVTVTQTQTRTVVDNNAIRSEINALNRGNTSSSSDQDGMQTLSIGVGIAIAGVAIAFVLRKR
jgi:hypothetical protein